MCNFEHISLIFVNTSIQSPGSASSLFHGIYTLPDAAHILHVPAFKLRRWLDTEAPVPHAEGVLAETATFYGISKVGIRGEAHQKHVDFLTLIELFTIYQLREAGVSFPEIRVVRSELQEEFSTEHPFALKGLLSDGRKIAREINQRDLLLLNAQGQRGFSAVLEDFFKRIDFEESSKLASRYHPCGRESAVVVDPRISFGRPVLEGTAIATETLLSLYKGGETPELIAEQFEIGEAAVQDALNFENWQAA